jgi:hypothetical protein
MIDGTIFGRLNATLDELDCAPKIEIILKEIR